MQHLSIIAPRSSTPRVSTVLAPHTLSPYSPNHYLALRNIAIVLPLHQPDPHFSNCLDCKFHWGGHMKPSIHPFNIHPPNDRERYNPRYNPSICNTNPSSYWFCEIQTTKQPNLPYSSISTNAISIEASMCTRKIIVFTLLHSLDPTNTHKLWR